jgi:hypothetical protein
MKNVTIKIGDRDLEVLTDIFKSEADFKPQAQQDRLIIEILKQILNNPKNAIVNIVEV